MEITFIMEILNFLLFEIAILVLLKLKIIPNWIAFYFVISGLFPFFFNDFLFPASYMPDQFKYLRSIQSIRSLDFEMNTSFTIFSASLLMSLFPLPFIESIISVAFINKFIFLILFVFLYKKQYLEKEILYFFLLYPDLTLYSSLALRDTLILTFMLVGVIYMINRRYLISLLLFTPLIFLKFQNFVLMLFLLLLYKLFMKSKFTYSKNVYTYFSILAVFLIIIMLIVTPYILEFLNHYRRAMFLEDGGDIENYIPLLTVKDFVYLSFKSAFYFLLKPFIFEASGGLQLIQSVINMVVFIFMIRLTKKSYKINKFKTLFWMTFLFISFTIYGLVVANFGTAARYRFPFIALYILGLSVDIKKLQSFNSKGNKNG